MEPQKQDIENCPWTIIRKDLIFPPCENRPKSEKLIKNVESRNILEKWSKFWILNLIKIYLEVNSQNNQICLKLWRPVTQKNVFSKGMRSLEIMCAISMNS